MQFKVLVATLTATLISVCAFAQEKATPGTRSSNAVTTATKAAAGSMSEIDQKFVEKAVIGGIFEVQSSQLAEQMATDEQVKQFAGRMIKDHTQANQELLGLTGRKGISPPVQLDEKHAEKLQKLGTSAGAEFDKQYVVMQVNAHQQAVDLFTKAAQNCSDPELKAFAGKTLPVLKEHLQLAKELPGGDQVPAEEAKKK